MRQTDHLDHPFSTGTRDAIVLPERASLFPMDLTLPLFIMKPPPLPAGAE